jgi:glycosyl transferase family 87
VALGFLFVPDARRHLAPYLGLFLAGAVVSLLAARSLSASRRGFLLLSACLFRATLLFRAPDLSEDVWRYLWDGQVARHGISPYRYAPDDPALQSLSSKLRAQVAHQEIRTVYPPVAQAVFRVFGGLAPFSLKMILAAADVAVVGLLYSAGGGFAAALYAFHPLPITEVAGQGHIDSLGVALLLAALLYVRAGRRGAAGLAFAASVLTKYVSIAAAIPLFRRGRLAALASSVLFGAAVWLAATRSAVSPAGDLKQFSLRWDFNSVLYPAAVRLMEATNLPESAKFVFIDWKERLHDPPWTRAVFPYFYAAFFARVLLAGILVVLLAVIGWRVADLETAVFASLGALLLLSPTLHPWYLLWVLPLAALLREPAFLFLAFAAPLAYALLYPMPGVSAGLVLALEYVPFALLLAGTLAGTGRGTAETGA